MLLVIQKYTQAIFTRFHIGTSVERVLAICSNSFAPLIKMAAMHICGKTLKNRQNQEIFEAKYWYITSETQGLPSMFK